ncbi:hypothetical protein FHS43_003301 [Streptosporangium becharense]|uniref:DUF3592 domain-containing protein n=1 Tax=Streptosporangium becharense TaxID=1816182 RepID=A0A7W9ID88_9ACTN|nr:hypothetical protein [Streptosporangium becharense]MBB2912021.1 hypothetical protein [Streptosporangium becharense]MBB5818568.1 hypothetical protein [Streptosporangium becharense]
MIEMRYAKTFRPFLLIPGLHIMWLPVGVGFLVPELLGHRLSTGSGTDMAVGVVACSLGAVAAVVTVALAVHFGRRDRERRFLGEYGLRARGVVTGIYDGHGRIQGRRLMRVHIESPEVPGLSFKHLTFTPPPRGSELTVAYDPADLRRGVVVGR